MHYSQVNNTLKTLSEEIFKLKKELETTYHSTKKAHHFGRRGIENSFNVS